MRKAFCFGMGVAIGSVIGSVGYALYSMPPLEDLSELMALLGQTSKAIDDATDACEKALKL